jgi:hypothetical protein
MSVGTPDWQGTPSVDRLTELRTLHSFTIADSTPHTGPVYKVFQYHSLQTYHTEDSSTYTGILPRTVTYSFYADSSATTLLGQYTYRVPCHGGTIRAQIPVLGPYFQQSWSAVATGVTTTVTIQMFGSYRTITKPRTHMTNALTETLTVSTTAEPGTLIYTGTVASGSFLVGYPDLWTGRAVVFVHTPSFASGIIEFELLDLVGLIRMAGYQVTAALSGADLSFETVITGEQPELRVASSAPGSNAIQVAINYEGALG